MLVSLSGLPARPSHILACAGRRARQYRPGHHPVPLSASGREGWRWAASSRSVLPVIGRTRPRPSSRIDRRRIRVHVPRTQFANFGLAADFDRHVSARRAALSGTCRRELLGARCRAHGSGRVQCHAPGRVRLAHFRAARREVRFRSVRPGDRGPGAPRDQDDHVHPDGDAAAVADRELSRGAEG